MPDTLETIRKRRSVRKYQAKPVPQEVILEVLSAASWAPSAHNSQPWRFIILENPEVKRKLAEAMAKSWTADLEKDGLKIQMEQRQNRVKRFSTAPVLILACLSMEGMNTFCDERRQSVERDLALQSLGAALQNMLLAAQAKGLGACWFCAPAFCKETVREVLKIPSEVKPQALIALGYPAEKPVSPKRKALDDFCFKDRWDSKLS